VPGLSHAEASALPALRLDAHGRRRVSVHAVLALAMPLFLNSGVQAVLGLTDAWFVGRLSTEATAALGAVYYLVFVFILLFGGVGMCVQPLVAQAYGARRRCRAARAVWTGLWGALLTAPFFVALALIGAWLLRPFDLAPQIEALALAYWFPRMLGGPVAVAVWVVTSFFNGIGRTHITLLVVVVESVVNAVLNEVFMFQLGWGIAGSAWATTVAMLVGLALGTAIFLRREFRRDFKSQLMWRPRARPIGRLLAFGMPMGLSGTVDLIGLSLFQLMQVKLGAVEGAASQIAMMLTSLAFLPAIGLSLAGTTLVGQSIGAGDKDWARRLGNTTILLCVLYMGAVGVLLAATSPWLLPLFVAASDPNAPRVIALGGLLLWLAACYQLFDGMNLGSTFCLRGAGDVRVPAAMVLVLAWFVWVPLAHMLTFAPGQGWVGFLPQFGYGAAGGWVAAIVYVSALGVTLLLRWRSGAWRRIRIG
jgi:MATE family multidrug resistance protein